MELGSAGAPPPCRQRHSGIRTPRVHLNRVALARLRTAGRSGRPSGKISKVPLLSSRVMTLLAMAENMSGRGGRVCW